MSRGTNTRTPERVARARQLRAAGRTYKEIGDDLGISLKTAHDWINDPGRRRLTARRDSYRGTCTSCGGPTDGSRGPGKAPDVCESCITWTADEVIAALKAWHTDHGRSPRIDDTRGSAGDLPNDKVTVRLFGSWNEALAAAGLPWNRDRTRETSEAMADLIAQGWTLDRVGERYGCTGTNVMQRIQRLGHTCTSLRSAA